MSLLISKFDELAPTFELLAFVFVLALLLALPFPLPAVLPAPAPPAGVIGVAAAIGAGVFAIRLGVLRMGDASLRFER